MPNVPPIILPPPLAVPSASGVCIICIASGKGGVGKTSVSLSLARQISRKTKLLIVDLDYFNRGATGLLVGRLVMKYKGVTLIESLLTDKTNQGRDCPVQIDSVEKEANLLFAGCSEVSEASMRDLEALDFTQLSNRLMTRLKALAEQLGVGCIVLDAHGGPDALSFAAACSAHYTVLVTDPDKVTLYGTLNFVARMREMLPPDVSRPRLKLLFNRISKKFSWRGLTQIYAENLSDLFDGELLGAIPFLPAVFDNFASAPFIGALFPKGLFATKIKLVAHDLLAGDWPHLLDDEILQWSSRAIKRTRETVHDNSLARPFPITITWLFVFLFAFLATLIVALQPEAGLAIDALLYVTSATAILLALLAIANSGRLVFQGALTSYRFQMHTALAGLYRWKVLLRVVPLFIISVVLLGGVGLLFPALMNAKARAQRISCENNMRQIGLAARIWEGDNNDQYPWNVSTNAGGTRDFCQTDADGFDANSTHHFEVMSNELSTPKILVCPADPYSQIASDFSNLQRTNVTYLVHSGTNVVDSNTNEVMFYCPIHKLVCLADGSVITLAEYLKQTNGVPDVPRLKSQSNR